MEHLCTVFAQGGLLRRFKRLREGRQVFGCYIQRKHKDRYHLQEEFPFGDIRMCRVLKSINNLQKRCGFVETTPLFLYLRREKNDTYGFKSAYT